MFVSFCWGMAVVLILFIINSVFSAEKDFITRDQLSPFECGFDSKQHGRVPFSIRFFLFVLLFLLFDIELIFFFHFPLISGSIMICQMMFVMGGVLVFWSFLVEEKWMKWEE